MHFIVEIVQHVTHSMPDRAVNQPIAHTSFSRLPTASPDYRASLFIMSVLPKTVARLP